MYAVKILVTSLQLVMLWWFALKPTALASKDVDFNVHDLFMPHLKQLHKTAPELKFKVLKLAFAAFEHAYVDGRVTNPTLTVIDYSLPSNQKRMWVFDIPHDKLLYKTFVAHGKNSGNLYANHFSNQHQSKASSIGTYLTQRTYMGGKGYSLNLQGLESGFNDHALNRRVVIHGAWYVEPNFIKQQGRAGRSWGCPAVGRKVAKPIINRIKNGSILFAYYPDKHYLRQSDYAHV